MRRVVSYQNRVPIGSRIMAGCVGVAVVASLAVPAAAIADPTSADKYAEQAEAQAAADSAYSEAGEAQAQADLLSSSAAEKQAQAEEALAQLNAMQETLDRLSAEYGQAVEAQMQAEQAHDAAEKRIAEIKEELAELQEKLGNRARDMYRNGSTTYMETLLGAATFEEFATNWDLLNRLNEMDASMVDRQRELKAEAEEQEKILAEEEAAAQQHAQEAEAARIEAEATVAEMDAIYNSLSEEAQALLAEQRAAQTRAEEARARAVMEQAVADAAAAEAAQLAQSEAAASASYSYDSYSSSSYSFDDDQVVTSGTAYEGGSDTVSRAQSCLGAPYVWGGVGPYGYDCSGLVSYCLTGQHTRLGTTYTFMNWPTVSDPQPGDIAVNWTHTGVYIGGGMMIHAADYGIGVIIGPVQSGMKIVRYGG